MYFTLMIPPSIAKLYTFITTLSNPHRTTDIQDSKSMTSASTEVSSRVVRIHDGLSAPLLSLRLFLVSTLSSLRLLVNIVGLS